MVHVMRINHWSDVDDFALSFTCIQISEGLGGSYLDTHVFNMHEIQVLDNNTWHATYQGNIRLKCMSNLGKSIMARNG